ncbi:MAG: radical SAM protein [Thermocladium sp.]
MFNPPHWLEELSGESKALEKAIHGDKLSINEIVDLIQSPFHALAAAADYFARLIKGNKGSFIRNIYLTYTNICVTNCTFCAFYARPGSERGYVLEPRRLALMVEKAWREMGIKEVHMVGGNNPNLEFSYYEELIKSIKQAAPNISLKAFTAEEIWFISKVTGNSVREVLERFKELGLNAMPGGGTEILDIDIQKRIAPLKASPEDYLSVQEEAHRLGIKTNSIMMYGHIEEPIHVAKHIAKLIELQKRAPGLVSFIPVRFNPGNTPLGKMINGKARLDGQYDLRIIAASRLAMLGLVDNIVAYWVSMGDKLAQAALAHGANDLGGTFYNEAVISAASGKEAAGKRAGELIYMLRSAGWDPYERDTIYEQYTPIGDALW